jgi:hypothetical protein
VTVADTPTAGHHAAAEIVPGDVSGGTNTSHTIVVRALNALLNAVPADAPHAAYAEAAIEGNVVGKSTEGARRRTFRYLRELYLLRPTRCCFGRCATFGQSILSPNRCSPASAPSPETRCSGPAVP